MLEKYENTRPMEEQVLYTDAGAELRFQGRLFSESTYFNEDDGSLTRLKLYLTADRRQVYSIVAGPSDAKRRTVYMLRMEDGMCHINNGVQDISLPTELLLSAVFGLCGIDPAQAEPLRSALEETLQAANC